MVISTQELAEHLAAGDVHVLDTTYMQQGDPTPGHFEKRIPTALFFDVRVIRNPDVGSIAYAMPTLEQFTAYMKQLGLPNNGKLVVVYDQNGFLGSPRGWFTLNYFGFPSVRMLDGGLPKWLEEGREVASGEYPLMNNSEAEGNYHFTEHPEWRARFEEVKEVSDKLASGDNSQLLWDGRPTNVSESGSVTHTMKVPIGPAFNPDKTIKNAAEVKAALENGGLDLTKPIITTCARGMNASIAYFLLKYIGKADVRIYLESFEEWKARVPS